MSFFKDGVDSVAGLLRDQGIPAVTSALQDLSDQATESWQKSLLKLGIGLVSDHGPEGLNLLQNLVEDLQNGKSVDLSPLSMQEASDFLAVMQRKEADTKNRVALYTTVVLETIAKALAVLISILFKEIKL